jgi:nitrite reductase/ring-hydroxylating ferredoxin subunit
MAWYKVAKESNMKDGDLSRVKVSDQDILLVRDKGRFFATAMLCTHEQYDLSEGFIDEGNIVCPNHFAIFRPSDGAVVQNPEGSGSIPPLKSYRVKVENGDVLVEA